MVRPLCPRKFRAKKRHPLQKEVTPAWIAFNHSDYIALLASSIHQRYRLTLVDESDLFQHGFTTALEFAEKYCDGRSNSACYWSYAGKRVRFAISDFATCRQGDIQRRVVRKALTKERPIVVSSMSKAAINAAGATQPAEADIDRREAINHLLSKLMDGMSSKQLLIIRMKHIDGFTNDEIGAVLKLKPSSVAVEAAEALAALRMRAIEMRINAEELSAVFS